MANEFNQGSDDPELQHKIQEYAAQIANPGPLYADPRMSVEQVVNPETGLIEGKRAQDVDYTKDRVKGVTEPWFSEKYTGVIPEIKTGAEAFANAVTLGGFDVVRSAMSSPEERREILERQKQNVLGSAIGEVAPFLIPEAAISKLGTIGKAIDFIPSLGGKAGSALGPEASSLARLTTEAAVANFNSAVSAGVANSALNDYSKDSVLSAVNESLLALGAGSLFGAGVGLLAPAIKSLGGVFKEGVSPELKKAAKEGFSKEHKVLSEFTDTIRDLQAKGELSERAANNAMAYNNKLVEPFMNFIEKAPGVPRSLADMDLDQLRQLDYLRNTIGSVYSDTKIMDDYIRTGSKDLSEHLESTQRAYEVSKRYNIFDSRPVKPVLKNMYEPINNQLRDMAILRRDIEPSREAFDKALLNSEIPKDKALNLANNLALADDSFVKANLNKLSKVFDPQTPEELLLRATVRPEYARDLHDIINGMANKTKIYSPKLTQSNELDQIAAQLGGKESKAFKRFIHENYPNLVESLNQQNLATPERAWDFLIGTRKKIGAAFEKYSKTATQDERNLVSNLYRQIDTLFPLLGKRAEDYAAVTSIYSDLGRSEKVLREVLGAKKKTMDIIEGGKISKEQGVQNILKAEIHPDAFDKLGAWTESSGKSLRTQENWNKGLENFWDVQLKSLQDLQRLTGKNLSTKIIEATARRDQALLANSDRQTITDYSLKRWYKMQNSIPKIADNTSWPEGSMSPRYRLTHMVHDLLSANTVAATRQGINLGVDWMTNALGKLKQPESINDYYKQTFIAINHFQKAADEIKTQSDGVVSKLINGIKIGDPSSVIVKTLPYQAMSFNDSNRNQIYNSFEKISKRLAEIKDDQSILYDAIQGVKNLEAISPGLGKQAQLSMINLLQTLTKDIPKSASTTQGGSPPPLIDQAKFLDQVIALTNPSKMLDMIADGSATSTMIATFKQSSPQIYGYVVNSINTALMQNKNVSLKERSRIKSMFPEIDSVLMPVPGAQPVSAIAPPPQNPGDQYSPTAMPKAKGVMKLDASKFNNFTQNGGTGVR